MPNWSRCAHLRMIQGTETDTGKYAILPCPWDIGVDGAACSGLGAEFHVRLLNQRVPLSHS